MAVTASKTKNVKEEKGLTSQFIIKEITGLLLSEMPNLSFNVDKEAVVPTTLDILDAILGGGFIQGGFHMMIGMPGSGKSTFAAQLLATAQKMHKDTIGFYIDAENAMAKKRLEQLGVDTSRVIPINRNITVETVFNTIKLIIQYKMDNPHLKEVPFVMVWDSIAFTPSERELASDDINETIGYKARLLSQMLPKWLGKLVEYNITLLAVNQLRDKISIGPYHAPADLRWMGEKDIPGGGALKFLAFQLLSLKAKSDAKEDMYGENGLIVTIKAIKNKNFAPNIDVDVFMSFNGGFDNFLTNMMLLKESKRFVSGAWNYLTCYPTKKFRTKDTKELYKTDPIFKENWDKSVKEAIEEFTQKHKPTNISDYLVEEQIEDTTPVEGSPEESPVVI